MKGMEKILENRAINYWVQHFKRSPQQINIPHESDAELIEVEGNDSYLLAITIDSVAEEITEGLYKDPFTMGWVTVMSNLSDLAAVGAEPLGIVIAVSVEEERDEKFRREIARGMAAACQKLGVFILGGDTNTTPTISLSGCAFGFVPRSEKITRVGCRAGDVIFMSGRAGTGNAMGLVRLAKLPAELFPEDLYRPIARIKEGQLVRKHASCCMDTSDGLLITLDQLLRINNLGFVVEAGWDKILAPEVLELCEIAKIPHWFMAAGIHGEFELVFTVPSEGANTFLDAANEVGFQPTQLGVVQKKPALEFVLPSGKRAEIDMAPLRNLWPEAGSDLNRIIKEHHAWGKKWGLE